MNYLLPGILLITIASSISYTAFRLFMDMKSGIFERSNRCQSLGRLCCGHVLTSLVATLISLVVVVLVALLMALRGVPKQWLVVAGILILFTLALTWLAVTVGLSAKTVERRKRVLLPAYLPALHQLGFRTHRNHARPSARLRRAPAGDTHRQRDPRPVHTAAGQHRHLDRLRLVRRHPRRRVRARDGHLPRRKHV